MAIVLSSINKQNLAAKHTISGVTIFPSVVIDLGDGKFQYSWSKLWSSGDQGVWEIFSSATNPVLNDKGLSVAAAKIGSFNVLTSSNEIIFILAWESLIDKAQNVYRTESTPPDLGDPEWKIWHQYIEDRSTWKWESRVSFRAGDHAIEHLVRSGDVEFPTHANAVPRGNNQWTAFLPGTIETQYSTAKQAYTALLIFPQGTIDRIGYTAYSDTPGTAPINGMNNVTTIFPDATRFNLNIPEQSTAQSIRFFITPKNGTQFSYLIPLV